jgi:hypothetical protein
MSLNDFEQTDALGRETYFVLPGGESETYAPLDTPPKQVLLQPLAADSATAGNAAYGLAYSCGADAALV